MESYSGAGGVPALLAIVACIGMTILYVAILYSPTLILRLPPPSSFKNLNDPMVYMHRYLHRRFTCCLRLYSSLTRIKRWNMPYLLSAYGIRSRHTLEAVVFPLCLTSLMSIGSFILKILSIWSSWAEHGDRQIDISFHGIKSCLQDKTSLTGWFQRFTIFQFGECILWSAPLTEELVFRACMISLLLCGGFRPYTVVLLSPVLFSLADSFETFIGVLHATKFQLAESFHGCRYVFAYAFTILRFDHKNIMCFQLGYTVIFRSYASFLFVRTGWSWQSIFICLIMV
ncbi:putative CAAX prenyl protease 2 [Helianthus anomalus]